MPFNGGGLSGFGFGQAGFGQAGGLGTTPTAGPTQQQAGVAAFGNVWASNNCPSCDVAIVNMQTQLIQAASRLGISSSTSVDHRVGTGTVATLQQVAQAAAARGLPAGFSIFNTPEMVAKNADTIVTYLVGLNQSLAMLPPVPQPSVPGNGAGPVITITPPVLPPGSIPVVPPPGYVPPGTAPKPKVPTAYLIGGGILLVGLIAAGVILMTPSKAHA